MSIDHIGYSEGAGFDYHGAQPTRAHRFLWPALKRFIGSHDWPDRRAFDLGCGNGATCQMIHSLGFEVTGVDISASGIKQAQTAHPAIHVHVGSVYDDLAAIYGTFPLVINLEVIEHCYYPRALVKSFWDLIAPGGFGFLSTPYHGYLKNLALAITGRMDAHFYALWDGGHIKFFSMTTLRQLLHEAGFKDVRFIRVGRIPPLAESMIAVVQKAP